MDFYKSHSDAITPTHAHFLDSGYDLYATGVVTVRPGEVVTVPTGIHIAFPNGEYGEEWFGGFIHDKSSRAAAGLTFMGGVIDIPYVGEIKIIIANVNTFGLLDRIYRRSSGFDGVDYFNRKYNEVIERDTVIVPYGKAIAQICFHAINVPSKMIDIGESEFRKKYAARFAEDQRGTGGFGSSSSPDRLSDNVNAISL